ncbi:MAG: 1-acyl-sn-glycerol-3-phosphate acyltransferase [Parasphingorhabdus sp.]
MTQTSNNSYKNPVHLLRQKRFLPFFLTQFAGAFNDNVFKNALIILITFSLATSDNINGLVNIAAGLFILPFFLFSSLAGQLADRHDKSGYMQNIKLVEIFIMIVGAIGLLFDSINLLLVVLFCMGAQSTFFGPAKYAILPQHLDQKELTGGNSLVEAGTFLAILLGTITGGILVSIDASGPRIVAGLIIVIAITGYITSRRIPSAPATDPSIKLNFNLFTESWSLLKLLKHNRTVFLSVLGISWFWFLGAVYLTQFPNFTRVVLNGDATVATLLLTLFSLGIGIGSFLCERLSKGKIEAGLVPIGAIGMAVFGIHFGLTEPLTGESTQTAVEFLANSSNFGIILDLFMIAVFGGIYIVPLYTLVQDRSNPAYRARIIAANNILNALFMVAAAGISIWVLGAGHSIPDLFLFISLFSVVVSIYIFGQAPEFLFRMIGWIMVHSVYQVSKQGLDHIPDQGAAVLVCNHVSLADAVILHAICPRHLRFVMDEDIYRLPVLNWLFRSVGAIPVTDPRIDRHKVHETYDRIAKVLENGELLCIFPEAGISRDGEIQKFKNGIEKIIKRTPAPVVPMAILGMWGSYFSRKSGSAMSGLPRRFFTKITILADSPVAPKQVTSADLQRKVQELRGDHL